MPIVLKYIQLNPPTSNTPSNSRKNNLIHQNDKWCDHGSDDNCCPKDDLFIMDARVSTVSIKDTDHITNLWLDGTDSLHLTCSSQPIKGYILYYMQTFPYSSLIFAFDMHFCFIYLPLCNSLL